MPLFWVSLGFLLGISLAHSYSFSILSWSIAAILTTVLAILFSRGTQLGISQQLNRVTEKLHFSPTILSLLMVFLSLGAIRYQLSVPANNPSFIGYYNDREIEYVLDGILTEPPDRRDTYANLRLKVKQLHAMGEEAFTPVNGSFLARVPANTNYSYGDLIRLEGHIVTPSENEAFSYREYLINQGIYSYLNYPSTRLLQQGQGNPIQSALFGFKQKALGEIYTLFPDPEASLMAGILLGVEGGIPPAVQEAFRLTGTSHIIVISGFNITIIAAVFALSFSRLLGKGKGALVAAIGIIMYTLLVGANAAVVRAALLGLLTLLGRQFGRRQVGLNSLAFTGAVMAMISPNVLWDVSFQLSFAATLGIMLYAEPFSNWFTGFAAHFLPREKVERLAGPVGEYLLLTLAAQVTTLPLMIYYFKRLSLTSLIANPLILPAQPAVMVLGGISVLSGMVFQPLGQIIAWITWPFMAYTIRIVEWLAGIAHGSIALGQVAFPLIIIFYAILFAVTFLHSQIAPLIKRLKPALPLTLMSVISIFVWKIAFSAPDNLLHITILDVGTGNSVLIQSPTGHYILINGGPSTISLSDGLGRRMPPLDRRLDWLVVADTDNEDLSGLPSNLERFKPRHVLWSGNTNGTRAARDLWSQLISTSIPIDMMQAGQSLDLGAEASLMISSCNEQGAVLLLQWENFRMLLPMGMDFEVMNELLKDTTMRNLSAVVLAESGYAPLNPPGFLSYLNPQLALLSVATADRSGLPSPETIQTLEGYNLLRTDLNGWIEILTDGEQMWVKVERQ
jgi:competence protein ComEC